MGIISCFFADSLRRFDQFSLLQNLDFLAGATDDWIAVKDSAQAAAFHYIHDFRPA